MSKKPMIRSILASALLAVPVLGLTSPMPPFSIKTLDGHTLTNRDLVGKVVVLDFWATWCGPCRAVSKIMQGLHKKYASQGVTVICLDVKEPAPSLMAVKTYIKEHGYTYTFGMPADNLDTRLGVNTLPTVIILDRKGDIQLQTTGYSAGTAPKLEATLKRLVKRA